MASMALRVGRPLEALSFVASESDPHGLALKGIALSQLQEFDRAKKLLRAARSKFLMNDESLWIAKVDATLAEIAFAERDFEGALRSLDSTPLRSLGDQESAAYIDIQKARLFSFLGRRRGAFTILTRIESIDSHQLAHAELMISSERFNEAYGCLSNFKTQNPILEAEAENLRFELSRKAFRYQLGREQRLISLLDIESIEGGYLDLVRQKFGTVRLSKRPAAFDLLIALTRGLVNPKVLFGYDNDSAQARLRVEISRLRNTFALPIDHSSSGYRLSTPLGLLSPHVDGLSALLADGQMWSARSAAMTLNTTPRSIERMAAENQDIEVLGRGRATRYRIRHPKLGIATQLLLLSSPESI